MEKTESDSNIKIRELKPEDFTSGFFESLNNLAPTEGTTPESAIAHLKKISKNPVYHFFVAEKDGKIVGVTTLLVEEKFIHGLSKVGHIEDVSARQGHEGHGVGSALVRHATQKAKALGCYKAILDCSEKTVAFYEKSGYKRHGVEMRIDFK